MITLTEYFMGRDRTHERECSPEIRGNAALTVARVNLLLARAEADGVGPGVDEVTSTAVASGWRPPAINSRTQNSATGSRHLVAKACDLQDTPGRELARWCLRNLEALAEIGLWMEDPQWTPDWVHLQTEPPGSGRRVYRPSMAEALVAKLPEQLEPEDPARQAAAQGGFGTVQAMGAIVALGLITALAFAAKNYVENVRADGLDAGRRAALLEVEQRDNAQLQAVQKRVLELQAELAEREARHQAEVARIDQEGTHAIRTVENQRDAARRSARELAGRLRDPGRAESVACPAGGGGDGAATAVAGASVGDGDGGAGGAKLSRAASEFLQREAARADEVAFKLNRTIVQLEACQKILVDDRRT